MSSNHIFADTNEAFVGDPVLQPGRIDGGGIPEDQIATLYDFEPIAFDGSENVMDAAVARTTLDDVDNATPGDGYGLPSSTTTGPLPRMRVMKYGRTTGLTKGRVEAINATFDVWYYASVARFVQQILIAGDGFARGGDSGSLVVVDRGGSRRNPVGLLFAGSGTHALANPIDLVLDRFGLVIDGN